MLLAANRIEHARRKFATAIALYHRIGAGHPRIDGVIADRQGAGL
jgi:hypothetical protein